MLHDRSRVLLRGVVVVVVVVRQAPARVQDPRNHVHEAVRDPGRSRVRAHDGAQAHAHVPGRVASQLGRDHAAAHAPTVVVEARFVDARHHEVAARDVVPLVLRHHPVGTRTVHLRL